MGRCTDGSKRQEWEGRFRRFRESGLSIAGFCAQEGVAAHTFYYWAKRVAAGSLATEANRLDRKQGALGRVPKNLVSQSTPSMQAPAMPGMVHIMLNPTVQLSIPGDCLEALRCVVQSVLPSGLPPAGAFQEVVLSSR